MNIARHCVRHRLFRLLAAAALMKLAPAAFAVEFCPKPVVAVLAQQAGIAPAKGAAPVIAEACKVWPHDPHVLLAALAYGKREETSRTLVVAMLDASTRRVIASYAVPVQEVQWGPRFLKYSLDIDTAPYQLAPDVRAFGVRFDALGGGNCPDRLGSEELTLFVPEGAELRPVLPRLATSRQVAKTGCFGASVEKLTYDDAKLTVAVGPASSHGLADLVVTARVQPVADHLPSKTAGHLERATLRYDGGAYQVQGQAPWWLTMSSW